MTRIPIKVVPSAKGGRLFPRYDAESDILTVTSESTLEWKYGFDIDGNIVFDLDANRCLANFDIHIGRKLWERKPVRQWPDMALAGALSFSKETVNQKSFNLPLRTCFDKKNNVFEIAIGNRDPDREIELSNECVALLAGEELVGFLIRNF